MIADQRLVAAGETGTHIESYDGLPMQASLFHWILMASLGPSSALCIHQHDTQMQGTETVHLRRVSEGQHSGAKVAMQRPLPVCGLVDSSSCFMQVGCRERGGDAGGG